MNETPGREVGWLQYRSCLLQKNSKKVFKEYRGQYMVVLRSVGTLLSFDAMATLISKSISRVGLQGIP